MVLDVAYGRIGLHVAGDANFDSSATVGDVANQTLDILLGIFDTRAAELR